MRTDPRDQCVRYIFELADGQLGELRSLDDVLEAP
jgi:hypothetical protein